MISRAERPLLAGEYAVLGLLAQEPRHGYELARILEDPALADVCTVEQSLLYAYLRNLERRELVEWEEVRVGSRPPRKTYTLSERGWAAFREWVHRPVERMREVRAEFLLKVYFLAEADPVAQRRLVQRQIDATAAYLDRARTASADSSGFARLVAESKRSAAEATLAWLRSYSAELSGQAGVRGPS